MNEKDFRLFARDHHVSGLLLDDFIKYHDNNVQPFLIKDNYIEPTIIEERRLNATQISVFSRLFMERILFLGMEINSDVANIINSQLLYLQTENPEKAITMYINSPGGSVCDGMSIYDVMKYVSCPISTTCCGMAASMAAVLLSSGDKGMRTALPHSKIMIHQPSGGTGHVQASDMEIAWKEMKKWQDILYQVLADNTGKSFDEIYALCDRDKWYNANEAVENGLIDSIISKKKK